jgi:hypothetical protein
VIGPLDVLIGQVKNPLLILLAATAGISIVLHDATIILAIIVLSVGLGFINEFPLNERSPNCTNRFVTPWISGEVFGARGTRRADRANRGTAGSAPDPA